MSVNIVGHCYIKDGKPHFKIYGEDIASGVFYIIINEKVKYIGKFENGIASRMDAYFSNHKEDGSEFHKEKSEQIISALKNNDCVRIGVQEGALDTLVDLRNREIALNNPEWNKLKP